MLSMGRKKVCGILNFVNDLESSELFLGLKSVNNVVGIAFMGSHQPFTRSLKLFIAQWYEHGFSQSGPQLGLN